MWIEIFKYRFKIFQQEKYPPLYTNSLFIYNIKQKHQTATILAYFLPLYHQNNRKEFI